MKHITPIRFDSGNLYKSHSPGFSFKLLRFMFILVLVTIVMASNSIAYDDMDEAKNAVNALNLPVDGTGIVVAVFDQGIWSGHNDLPTGSKVIRSVLCNDDHCSGIPSETRHGTRHGGIIAGLGSIMPENAGIAPGALLLNVDTSISGSFVTQETLEQQLQFSLDNNARVVSIALGSGVCTASHSVHDSLGRAVDMGMVVVASAGNAGSSASGTIEEIPCSANVIAVGAIDENRNLWVGSINRSAQGPSFDGRIKPEIVAPGKDIFAPTTMAGPAGYDKGSGTSWSAPIVSGAAALILEAQSHFTPLEVKMALLLGADWQGPASTTTDLYDSVSNPTYDALNQFGFGILNVGKSLAYADHTSGRHIIRDHFSVSNPTEDRRYRFTAPKNTEVKILLSWFSHPSGTIFDPIAAALSNLDIHLLDSNGQEIDSAESTIQNNEFIVFTTPGVDDNYVYTIQVKVKDGNVTPVPGTDFEVYALGCTHDLTTVPLQNDLPEANSKVVNEDVSSIITVPLDGFDPDGDRLSFFIEPNPQQTMQGFGGPQKGKARIKNFLTDRSAELIYTPTAGAFTSGDSLDVFTIAAFDGLQRSHEATINIKSDGHAGDNTPPIIVSVTNGTNTEEPIEFDLPTSTIDVSVQASDLDGDHLTFEIVDLPAKGDIVSVTNIPPDKATINYQPDATGFTSFDPFDTFSIRAVDGEPGPASSITVKANIPTGSGALNANPQLHFSMTEPIKEGQLVILDGSQSVPQGNVPFFFWSQVISGGGAEAVELNTDVTSPLATFVAPYISNPTRSLEFDLKVGNGFEVTTTDSTLDVTIHNVPPTFVYSPNEQVPHPNPSGSANLFGASIASLNPTKMVIGSPNRNSERGAIYIYDRVVKTSMEIENPQGTREGFFGKALSALNSDTYVVGAPGNEVVEDDDGIVYIYDRDGNEIGHANGIGDDKGEFGTSVAAVGDSQFVAGAPKSPHSSGLSESGAAFLFDINDLATPVTLLEETPANTPEIGDRFGESVIAVADSGAGDGDARIAVGVPGDKVGSQVNAGSVHLFDFEGDFVGKITSDNPTANGEFGIVLAPVGLTEILIAAPGEDAVYLYDLNDVATVKTTYNLPVSVTSNFLRSILYVEETDLILVGVTNSSIKGEIFVFEKNGEYQDDLTIDENLANVFGSSLANIGDGVVVIGAEGTAANDGAVFVVRDSRVLNEPPVITGDTFNIAENVAVNTFVGSLAFGDPDQGDQVSFTILGGNTNNAFKIDNVGVITVNNTAALDYETGRQFILTVQIQDSGMLTDQATVTINLSDANESPVITPISNQLVSEDNVSAMLVEATDENGDPITLGTQNLPAFFQFLDVGGGTGVIYLNGTPVVLGKHTITITADDGIVLQPSSIVFDLYVNSADCTLTINPKNHVLASQADDGLITVTTSSPECYWTVTSSDESWLPITPESFTKGNDVINYTVLQNSDITTRTGALRIGEQRIGQEDEWFNVTQAGSGMIFVIDDEAVTVEGTSVSVGVLVNDLPADPNNQLHVEDVDTAGTAGSIDIGAVTGGFIPFEPATNFVGTTSFTYVANDVDPLVNASASATVTVYVVTNAAQGLLGDFNNDGAVDAIDIDAMAAALRTGSTISIFDIDNSGTVDWNDYDYLITDVICTLFGDATLDLVVSLNDFGILAANFGQPGGWAKGDFNGDGLIDYDDFDLLSGNYNSSSTPCSP